MLVVIIIIILIRLATTLPLERLVNTAAAEADCVFHVSAEFKKYGRVLNTLEVWRPKNAMQCTDNNLRCVYTLTSCPVQLVESSLSGVETALIELTRKISASFRKCWELCRRHRHKDEKQNTAP